MSIEIIVKANDGRGRGHIGRVINFVDYEFFRDMLKLVVNRDYSAMVPERMICSLVRDDKWRVNLDWSNDKAIYKKEGNVNHSKGKAKISQEVQDAIQRYYFSVLDGAGKDTRLIYIDDQNAPETLFPELIAKIIGVASPGTIKGNAPNARQAYEIETQIWNKTGDFAMGETRRNCFENADYLHLSTDIDFFRSAVGKYSFGTHFDKKIIPMGFPISRKALDLFNSIAESRASRRDTTSDSRKAWGIPDQKKIIYTFFGAGEGAEDVYETLLDAFDDIKDDFNLVISNTDDIEKKLSGLGYQTTAGISTNIRVTKTKKGNSVYLVKHSQLDHMKTLAIADILVQGNGSGTTYEGIASYTPSICIPLNRPGYEQIIKGIGVENCGGGRVLFLNSLLNQVKEFRDLTGQDGNMPGETYNTANLVSAIKGVIEKDQYRDYKDNLRKMRSYFADPNVTARSVLDMANGREPQQIIRNNRLKSFL